MSKEQIINFNFTEREWQRQVFENQKQFTVLAVHRRAGKSTLSCAELITKAITTKNCVYAYIAPQLKQSKAIAWKMLKDMCEQFKTQNENGKVNNLVEFRESELIVRFWTGSEIKLFGADNYDALRGIKLAGAVIDEVAQMPKELWEEVVSPALMDSNGFALFIGTPKGVNLFSDLYNRGFDPAFEKSWKSMTFNCYQTDALSKESIELYKLSVSEEIFKREMMCDFTASGTNNLLSQQEVYDAYNRVVDPAWNQRTDLYMGVDVARFGADRSVIFFRKGLVAEEPIVLQGLDLVTLAKTVKRLYIERAPKQVFVDGTGVGGGLVDMLMSWGIYVNDINFGHKSIDKQYLNVRTEIWCKMAEWVKRGAVLPKNSDLLSELCMPQYDFNDKMQKVLETKKEIRERLGKSPDLADALALTFALDFGQSSGAKDSYEELLNELEERREYEQQQQQTAWDRFEHDIGERIFF